MKKKIIALVICGLIAAIVILTFRCTPDPKPEAELIDTIKIAR